MTEIALVVIRPDPCYGQLMHALTVDGERYGSFGDLEAVNILIAAEGMSSRLLVGAAPCDWQTGALLEHDGVTLKRGSGVPCGLLASRTVIWESPAFFGVRLTCAAHLGVYVNLPAEWRHCVLGQPASRRGHAAGFAKRSVRDMRLLRAILAGQDMPAGALPGLEDRKQP